MKKVLGIWLVIFSVISVSMVAAQEKPIVLKMAHGLSPDHPLHLADLKFAEMVAKRTNNKIQVQVFPANQLGGEKDQLEGVMVGSIDICQVSPGAVSLLVPPFGILDCPYIFRDIDHVTKVLHGQIGKELSDQVEKARGIRMIDLWWYYGTRHLTTRNKPIYKPEDLAGMKIRAPEQPLYMETVRAMGGNAAPVAFADLYMALKMGTVDGQENPVHTIYTYKYYEAQKYLMLTGHMIRTNVTAMNAKRYHSLSPGFQKIIDDSIREAGTINNNDVINGEGGLIEKLKGLGMTVIGPKEGLDLEAFRRTGRAVALKFEERWGKGAYERIVAVK